MVVGTVIPNFAFAEEDLDDYNSSSEVETPIMGTVTFNVKKGGTVSTVDSENGEITLSSDSSDTFVYEYEVNTKIPIEVDASEGYEVAGFHITSDI